MRRAVVALAVAATLAGAASIPAGASAAPLRDCTPTHGTIVAVNFGHWHGPIVRGCGVSEASGYELLHGAGFTTAGDEHDGPAFICRLGDSAFHHGAQYPTPVQEDCILTPPASAYWSYWLAPAGSNHWEYSPLGAMSETPKPGEVELWTFGATNVAGTRGSGVPSMSPDSLRPPAASPPSSTSAPRRTASSTIASAGARLIAARPSARHASSGSATPLIIGIALAVLLGAGAARTMWVRRREA